MLRHGLANSSHHRRAVGKVPRTTVALITGISLTAALSSDGAPNGVEVAVLAGKGCHGRRSGGQVEVKVRGENGVVVGGGAGGVFGNEGIFFFFC